MITLGDYRLRHAQYKRDPDSQALHRQHPLICIWDDHEITNDSWTGGAENHTEGVEGAWPERVRNQRAYRIGELIDLVMLEERLSARSQQLPATVPTPFGNGFVQAGPFLDPTRTLLGADQEAWLAQRLRGSDARWKIIGQGVMFAQLKLLAAGGGVFVNSDRWDGYQPARDRVYAVLKGDATQPAVNNVVVPTGDIHSSWAAARLDAARRDGAACAVRVVVCRYRRRPVKHRDLRRRVRSAAPQQPAGARRADDGQTESAGAGILFARRQHRLRAFANAHRRC